MDDGRPTLKVAAFDVEERLENGTIVVGGVTGDFLNYLAKYMHFKYDVLLPPDHQWGHLMDNGTWSGMIGMVNRSEVEFSVGPFSLSPSRNAAVQFTVPILYDNDVIMVPRPKLESDMEGFHKPFSWKAWLLTLASLVVISILLIFIQLVEEQLGGLRTSNLALKSFTTTYKALLRAGCDWIPAMDGGRVVMATWLLTSLILVTAYSGILVAMLTLPRVTIPIDSIDDLVHQRSIPWRLIKGTVTTKILEESHEESRRLAFTQKQGYIVGNKCNDLEKDIALRKYAALCPTLMAHKMLMKDYRRTGNCRLYIAKEKVYFDRLAFAFRPGSPYFQRANRVLLAVHESGVYSLSVAKHYPPPTRCLRSPTHDKPSGINALDIRSLGGPFLLLLGGLLLALLSFMAEILAG